MTPAAGGSSRQFLTRGIAVAVGLAAVGACLPILDNRFVVYWDDGENFLNNPAFRGLGWAQVRWAWTTLLLGVYQPIVMDALWRRSIAFSGWCRRVTTW